MKVQTLADQINKDCENKQYFWAVGLIRETLKLWQQPQNYDLLNEVAQSMVDRYAP